VATANAVQDERRSEEQDRHQSRQALLPGLDDHRQRQRDGGCRGAVQDALHGGHLLEPKIEEARHHDQTTGIRHSPNSAAAAPKPTHLRPREDRHVDLIRTWQDSAHRHRGEELRFAHPLFLDDQHLAGPRGKPAAERGERDVVERPREFDQ